MASLPICPGPVQDYTLDPLSSKTPLLYCYYPLLAECMTKSVVRIHMYFNFRMLFNRKRTPFAVIEEFSASSKCILFAAGLCPGPHRREELAASGVDPGEGARPGRTIIPSPHPPNKNTELMRLFSVFLPVHVLYCCQTQL